MEKIITYAIAIVGIIIMMIIWVFIQNIWKNTFKDHLADEDALAGRSSCGNCGCGSICEKNDRKK
ncbi:MAG: hypothetical protein RLN79_04575 [Cytophagales bacterium]